MTVYGPQKLTHFGGHPLYDHVAGFAEIDMYMKQGSTDFVYSHGEHAEVRSYDQQWYVIRRYVKEKLHSILHATAYKLTYIRPTMAVVAIPVGDGPGRRYFAVGFIKFPHHQSLIEGNDHGNN